MVSHRAASQQTSRWHTWHHHITSATTLTDAGIHSIESYLLRHQLWRAGHASRMPTSRISRKFISSWCRAKRPTGGASELTYGRTLLKALEWTNVDAKRWHILAQDRGSWRDTIDTVRCSIPVGWVRGISPATGDVRILWSPRTVAAVQPPLVLVPPL